MKNVENGVEVGKKIKNIIVFIAGGKWWGKKMINKMKDIIRFNNMIKFNHSIQECLIRKKGKVSLFVLTSHTPEYYHSSFRVSYFIPIRTFEGNFPLKNYYFKVIRKVYKGLCLP